MTLKGLKKNIYEIYYVQINFIKEDSNYSLKKF